MEIGMQAAGSMSSAGGIDSQESGSKDVVTRAHRPSQPLPVSQRERQDKQQLQDFFLPASKRRKVKDEPTELKGHQTDAKAAKPRSQKKGKIEKPVTRVQPTTRGQAISAKENNLSNSVTRAEVPTSVLGNEVQPVEQNLRLEAVLAAQENARLNVGKTTHPFFAKKNLQSARTSIPLDEPATCHAEDLQPCPPIHITQWTEDERTTVPLLGSEFFLPSAMEVSKVDGLCEVERRRFRLVELCVPSKDKQNPNLHRCTTNSQPVELATSAGMVDFEETFSDVDNSKACLRDVLKYIQTLKSPTEVTGEKLQPPENIQTFAKLEERLKWYSARRDTLTAPEYLSMSQLGKDLGREAWTRNLLWTDVYQPKSSKELCGNSSAVELLRSWLHNWQQKITGQLKYGEDYSKDMKRDRQANCRSDKGWFEDDSDIESDVDDDLGLSNTLLVTGPEGCGKSAAVYACAAEHGFTVIEVNASDCRNGSLIKHKFREAMESHGLGKVLQGGGESPQQASKKRLNEVNMSHGSGQQNTSKQKTAPVEKTSISRSPLRAHQGKKAASQEEAQMDSQGKRRTVILFEDVDKDFEEDKGFVTALLQLSKITKRPIILTSNKLEPGLPQGLGNFRIDFSRLTSEELVLHACLVCIAEGVSCSPLFVERLVDSCQFDLRKVMMALQFWGQGKDPVQHPPVLSRSEEFVTHTHNFEHVEDATPGSCQRINRECQESLNLTPAARSKISVDCLQDKGILGQLDWDARWLFELDIPHIILPKIISGNDASPLFLFVAEKVLAASSKQEAHAAQVAARDAENRAGAQLVKLEIAKLAQKALLKEQRARRKASLSQQLLPEDHGSAINATPDDDIESEHSFGENLVYTPVKSVREAKILARSPVKPRILKQKRVLLLFDSDDEKEQTLRDRPEQDIECREKSFLNIEASLSDAQMVCTTPPYIPVDADSENLEDLDALQSAICQVPETIRRKRLSKQGAFSLNCLTHMGSLTGSEIADRDEKVPPSKLESLGTPEDKVEKSQFLELDVARHEVSSSHVTDESNDRFVEVKENDKLTIEMNLSNLCESKTAASLESSKQLLSHNCDSTGDKILETILFPGSVDFGDNTSVGAPIVQLPDSSEVGDHVSGENLPSPMPQLCCRKEVAFHKNYFSSKSVVFEQPNGSGSKLGGSVEKGFHSELSDFAETTVKHFSLGTLNSQGANAVDAVATDLLDYVKDVWTSLRDSQHTNKTLSDHSHGSRDVTSSFADLLDFVSASDMISSVRTGALEDDCNTLNRTVSQAFHGSIAYCSDWDGCQEVASQLVLTGLHHFLSFLPAVKCLYNRLPVLACILESAKDASAVGRCMATHKDVTSNSCPPSWLHGTVADTYIWAKPKRQVQRQTRLDDMVQTVVLPKGRVPRSDLVEYTAYLSRMSQLEEVRRAHGLSKGRRPRKFEHYLTSKFRSFSESDITELLMRSRYTKT